MDVKGFCLAAIAQECQLCASCVSVEFRENTRELLCLVLPQYGTRADVHNHTPDFFLHFLNGQMAIDKKNQMFNLTLS